MRKRRTEPRRQERGPRVNEKIRIPEVLLIDEEGKKIGIVPTAEALTMASERGLDLVEVAPHLRPPIAKIVDYGKFKYEQKKQARGKKRKILEMKEVRLSVNIDEHDLATKYKKIIQFLGKGHQVKLAVFFRGRQMAHKELGNQLLRGLVEKLANSSTLEQGLTPQGRMTFVVLAPKKIKS